MDPNSDLFRLKNYVTFFFVPFFDFRAGRHTAGSVMPSRSFIRNLLNEKKKKISF